MHTPSLIKKNIPLMIPCIYYKFKKRERCSECPICLGSSGVCWLVRPVKGEGSNEWVTDSDPPNNYQKVRLILK